MELIFCIFSKEAAISMKHNRLLFTLRKIQISKRLLFLFIIQTSIILLWCTYVVKNSLDAFENNIRFHNSQMINSVSYNLDHTIKELNMATKIPVIQAANSTSYIFDYLAQREKRVYSYPDYSNVSADITNIFAAYGDAAAICVSDNNGSIIYGNGQTTLYYTTTISPGASFFQEILNGRGSLLVIPQDQVTIPNITTPRICIWGARAVMLLSPHEPIGVILFCMDITSTIEAFNMGKYYQDQAIGIFDQNGRQLVGELDTAIYQQLKEEPASPLIPGNLYETTLKTGSHYNLYHYALTNNGLLVAISTPNSHIISDSNRQQIGLYFLLLFLVLSIIIITRLLVDSINTPIKTLVKACNAIQNEDFSIRIKDDANDEMHGLIVSFNTMSDKIHFLIQEIYQKDLHQARTELQMLRSQINPHFMYNTLETIRAFALTYQNYELAQMVSLLGKTLRYGVSSPSEPVTLGQEVDNLYDYIELQNIHLQGRLTFNVNIESALMDSVIIKLLLQPLVENAIYHGIGVTEKTGIIDIFGFSDGTTLTFKVADNGIGIEKEELDLLNDYINNKNDRFKSIGLKNVNRRIKLYYGEYYGLHLDSVRGRGTIITICIPHIIQKQEENHDITIDC